MKYIIFLVVFLSLSASVALGQIYNGSWYNTGYHPGNLITPQSWTAGVGSQGNFFGNGYGNPVYVSTNAVAATVGFVAGAVTGAVINEVANSSKERKAAATAVPTPATTTTVTGVGGTTVISTPRVTNGGGVIKTTPSVGVIQPTPRVGGSNRVIIKTQKQ